MIFLPTCKTGVRDKQKKIIEMSSGNHREGFKSLLDDFVKSSRRLGNIIATTFF
jgi:hypothetical protein